MVKQDQVETEKAEIVSLAETIERNICSHYPKPPIPNDPFFLQVPNTATEILCTLLSEAENDPKVFSRLAAKQIIKFRELEHDFITKKAFFLRENIDLSNLMEQIKKIEITATTITFKVSKSKSTKGPITLKFRPSNGKEFKMEESDSKVINVRIADAIKIDFVVDDDGNQFIIDSINLSVSKIIEEIYYMKAAEKPELEKKIHKKGADFEVKVTAKLELCAEDRVKILNKKNKELSNTLEENDRNLVVYKDMQSSLMINFNEDGQTFRSSISKKKARENCCEICSIC